MENTTNKFAANISELLRRVATTSTDGASTTRAANMLSDDTIGSLDTHLQQFKLKNRVNQNELEAVLNECSSLLKDYQALKKAHEGKGEEKDDQNGVQITTEETRNPYVLMLVDGNGYIFNDEFVKDKEEGGMRAARMLSDAIDKYLRQSHAELSDYHVIVRIYADLTNLSKALAKTKLIGLEKRSLAPFAAGFTRAINHFDFVDALDEEGTKFKIREAFKLAGEDHACSHILYAACHDTGYLTQLVPHSGLRDKITLVQGAGFNSEFHQFGLNVTQFPTIFRWSELASSMPSIKPSTVLTTDKTASPMKFTKAANQTPSNHSIPRKGRYFNNTNINLIDDDIYLETKEQQSPTNGFGSLETNEFTTKKNQVLCRFFKNGFCKNGSRCPFQHDPNGNLVQQQLANNPHRANVSSLLPVSVVSGFVPLNKDLQRLDTYIQPPNQEDWIIYNKRFHLQKPCNTYQLQGFCTSLNCTFDHSELEPEAMRALRYVLKCNPCPRKGACRVSDCFYGHVCQKDGCSGQMKGCKMKAERHAVDPRLASMVPAVEEEVRYDDVQGEIDSTWY